MRCEVQSSARGAPRPARVRALLSRVARMTASRAGEVSVLFCGDARMRGLNRRYRGMDRSTDVLAFAPDSRPDPSFLGDIVVSVPYAVRQARLRGERASREMDRLLVHGFLHLLGYDHETDDGEMEALETRVRKRLGIADSP
ncbi:MAG: rRNA maturation RNase YbeY [Acidobacteriota bacterium]|nr:rRNA maturation RNase YbeY [Acidobacteriota bacterium]MDQ2980452.1 rRNA maturation RNase YbeY [Acidobacteriota bacterium]